jgi:hypothetical protein
VLAHYDGQLARANLRPDLGERARRRYLAASQPGGGA